MASTLTQLYVHLTFSTKNRRDLIAPELEQDLFAYVGGICRAMNSPLRAMGGMPDHVHMIVSLAKTVALSDLMLNVKRDSSRWMSDNLQGPDRFAWQDGYFGFSLSSSKLDLTRRYIANQKQHHRKIDFKDEVRSFLTKYKLEWDERYAWD